MNSSVCSYQGFQGYSDGPTDKNLVTIGTKLGLLNLLKKVDETVLMGRCFSYCWGFAEFSDTNQPYRA